MKQRKRMMSVILTLMMVVTLFSNTGFSLKSKAAINPSSLFGPNVYVFDENDSQADIQATIDYVFGIQETNQFGSERHALLFKPGTYDNVKAKVGFYTHVAGLGVLPTDTVVNEFDCNAFWMQNEGGFNATCNFWRRAENFTVNETSTWAVAQATSLRRMNFKNWLALDQWGQGWASGGFVADTVVEGFAVAYSQQQYMSRNTDYGGWSGGVWNGVFVGNEKEIYTQGGKLVENNWDPDPGYEYLTVVDESPVIREQPYLTVDNNDNYSVFVPSLRNNAKGVSWKNGAQGKSISINEFHIAMPERDTAATINAALNSGKHLLLTPGIYNLEDSIKVNNPNTVVLGLGYATLAPKFNHACIEVADVDGVSVSGLLFDAGPAYTETLLKVGQNGSNKSHAANPTLLSDLFFRVGGVTASVAQSETCIIINSNDVIGDNFWVWRADHGDGVAWDLNLTKNGVVVNGDNVTMFGLFVEHFHEYQTLWNGENGRTYFYQSEIPYDVPNQASWMSKNGTVNGYASYKIADNVKNHEAYGLGIYSFHRDATIDLNSGAEVPDTDGVTLNNICTVMLAGYPGISHVVNNTGNAVTTAGMRQQVVKYGNGTGTGTPNPNPNPNPDPDPETPGTGTNLAEGKTATASSSSGGNVAANAVDGQDGTRWESEHSDDQWISVDLGSNYDINKVSIMWEAAAGKDYTIDVSTDGNNWNTVAQKSNGTGGTDELSFNTVNARYVRMKGIARVMGYGYSIFEFKVFGSGSGNSGGNDGGSTNPGTTLDKIEAENYTAMNGVEKEACNDEGGGENIGWIDQGDWMDYTVKVPASGTYKIDVRVNGWNPDAALDVIVGGKTVTTVNVKTDGWQTVTSAPFQLNEGTVTVRLHANANGFNLNWFQFVN